MFFTFLECSQRFWSVLSQCNTQLRPLHLLYDIVAKNNKTRFFYVLYCDKTWVFDQSERVQGPIYNIYIYIHTYRISSTISLVIFSESDTEISEIFHEKHGLSHSQGFGIQKQFLNLLVLLFFADNTNSVGRSLTFRVLAYR